MFHHSSQIDFANCLNSYFTKKSNESRNAMRQCSLIVLCTIVIITIGQEGVKGRLKVKSTWAKCGPSQSQCCSDECWVNPFCPESPMSNACCSESAELNACCPESAESNACCPESAESNACCPESAESNACCSESAESNACCPESAESNACCPESDEWNVCCPESPESNACCPRQQGVKCVLSQTAGSQMRVVPDNRESIPDSADQMELIDDKSLS